MGKTYKRANKTHRENMKHPDHTEHKKSRQQAKQLGRICQSHNGEG